MRNWLSKTVKFLGGNIANELIQNNEHTKYSLHWSQIPWNSYSCYMYALSVFRTIVFVAPSETV